MEYFLRASSYVKAENALLALSIAHNPYTKQSKMERLPRHLKRMMRQAKVGEPVGIDMRDGGTVGMTGESLERQMRTLQGMFGPVRRVTLSREEFEKRMRARP